MSKKPLPPYGDLLQKLQQYVELKNYIFIYCGRTAVKETKASLANGVISLCLPYPNSFADYRWPVNGCRLIITDTGGMALKDLHLFVLYLAEHGAACVTLDSIDQLPPPHIQIFTSTQLNTERTLQ